MNSVEYLKYLRDRDLVEHERVRFMANWVQSPPLGAVITILLDYRPEGMAEHKSGYYTVLAKIAYPDCTEAEWDRLSSIAERGEKPYKAGDLAYEFKPHRKLLGSLQSHFQGYGLEFDRMNTVDGPDGELLASLDKVSGSLGDFVMVTTDQREWLAREKMLLDYVRGAGHLNTLYGAPYIEDGAALSMG